MKERRSLGSQRAPQANQVGGGLPWKALEQQVTRLQKQIAQASRRGESEEVHRLQQRLMESEAARLLAVRRVTEENQGKDTAGVDGVKSLTATERLAMAAEIHPHQWRRQPPLPVRRVWIAKPGTTERRPLAVLPMIDRCKQALVKLALEAEWEPRFEAHSYGYRPGLGAHDAIVAILAAIERCPSYVFDADIEEAFDSVDQAALLDKLQTYPALREVIHAWLKAGVIDGPRYLPSETGIAQGGVLSPLLLNVALHGMEAVVTQSAGRELPLLVRYADDFVIVHADLNVLHQAIGRVTRWLATMGLRLNADKTRITHTLTPHHGQVGLDFLGFSLRQEAVEGQRAGKREPGARSIMTPLTRSLALPEQAQRVRTIVAPSQEASRRHLAVIDQRLRQLQTAPQTQVIANLNPLIAGWSAYYTGLVPAATMGRYDDLLEQRLLAWAAGRHPGKDREWLLARYWQRSDNNRRMFAPHDGTPLRTYRPKRIL